MKTLKAKKSKARKAPAHRAKNGPVVPEVQKIRRMHKVLMESARRSLAQAIDIGGLLVRLKKKVGHGGWGAFVEEHLKLEARTCQNYMRLFESKDQFKSETVSDLPLGKAYLMLRRKGGKQPGQTAMPPLAPKDGTQGAFDPAAGIDDTNGQKEEVTLRFLNGEPMMGWHDGLISTQKIEREFLKIEKLPASVPQSVRLAQQRVYVRAACEINLVCGGDPEEEILKAIEVALSILRNSVVTHRNYRRFVPCSTDTSDLAKPATIPNRTVFP